MAELWDFRDPAGSEARFRAAVVAADPRRSRILATQVARALGLQDRFEEGHAVLDEIDDPGDDPELAVRVLLERGRLYRSAGDDGVALPLFERAAASARTAGLDALQIDALHMLALVQQPDDGRATTERALALARASSEEAALAWEGSLLNNLGMSHADAGEWPEALDTFEQALTVRRRVGDPETEKVARWMVAWALRNLGRADEALAIQRALRAEHEAAGTEDPFVLEELALLEPGGEADD